MPLRPMPEHIIQRLHAEKRDLLDSFLKTYTNRPDALADAFRTAYNAGIANMLTMIFEYFMSDLGPGLCSEILQNAKHTLGFEPPPPPFRKTRPAARRAR